ncbi:hypothetical protein ACFC09_31340 [Streptomyces sp. NPDC056161]
MKKIVVGALAAAVATVVVQSLPDLRRYLKIRSM